MNESAFDRAVVEFGRRLPAYFRSRINNAATAEDLAQETLLKAFRSRSALRDETRIESWLYRIAHGTMVDYYRRHRTLDELPVELAGEAVRESECVREMIVCSARCYLETLPKTYRDPVHLAEYEGLSHLEIARKLRLNLTAVKARVRRGKLMVRSLMEARCHFEYDALGNIIGYQVREMGCLS